MIRDDVDVLRERLENEREAGVGPTVVSSAAIWKQTA
jgi:hypothetical protein